MRAGIGAVYHTLTPEASSVIKRAIADAQRRGHAQVTPLHVASSLLSAPSNMLQQACLKSHHRQQVPHPLHSRALELCFNVALDRLPAASPGSSSSINNSNSSLSHHPETIVSLSNALVAALKRAQAHQRRGSTEQQQVPLLAVKVEMEQLVISILDDPSVSRVMREAGFSSTRAKNSLEHSSSMTRRSSITAISSSLGCDLEIISCSSTKPDQSSAALGVLGRSRRQRNPVLIGDELSTSLVVKEVVKAIRLQEQFRGARVLNLVDNEKSHIAFGVSREVTQRWISEMLRVVDDDNCLVPILVLIGSLNWCEQSPVGGLVLGELARVLTRAESKQKKFWFIACATSHCYMRFLAQFPAMENQLGFQPLPISSSNSIRPRFSSASDSQTFLRNFPKMPFRLVEDDELGACCSECTTKFEHESSKLQQHAMDSYSSSGDPTLPLWVKNISREAPSPGQARELVRELKRKWIRSCQSLHSPATTLPNLIDSNSSSSQTSSPEGPSRAKKPTFADAACASWLSLSTEVRCPDLSLGLSLENSTSCNKSSPKVTTELSLGVSSHPKTLEDESGCTPASQNGIEARGAGELSNMAELFKSIFKGLREKVPWQMEAAGKVAAAIISSRSGERRRGSAVKNDAWMMFTGGDRMGKRRLAKGLAEELYGSGENMVVLSLSGGSVKPQRKLWSESFSFQEGSARGRTVMDRVADAIKAKPFSVVLLEDYDQADVSVRRSLERSMERGKIQQSSGREVGFGNLIFILTVNSREKSPVEETLESVQLAEIHSMVKDSTISGEDDVHGTICITEQGNVLIQEALEGSRLVGEKRKSGSGSRWGDKIETLLTSRKKVVRGLDLNLGLGCWDSSEGDDEEEGLKLDERVEFEDLKTLEFVAATVMERIEKLAYSSGVRVEVELRALETMLASVWEEAEGFDKWFKETIEVLVSSSRSDRKFTKVLQICC